MPMSLATISFVLHKSINSLSSGNHDITKLAPRTTTHKSLRHSGLQGQQLFRLPTDLCSPHWTFQLNVTISAKLGQHSNTHLCKSIKPSRQVNGKEVSRTPTYLFPGDLTRLEMHDNTVLITRDKNSLDEARNRSSWIDGRLITGGERLDEVLWELNARSNKTQLLIGDPEIAQKRIGGNFDLMHVDEFLQTARIAFGLEVIPVKEPGVDDISTYILRLPTDDSSPVSRHRWCYRCDNP